MSFKGAKQVQTAFVPKIEAARPEGRPALIDAMLTAMVWNAPTTGTVGRWPSCSSGTAVGWSRWYGCGTPAGGGSAKPIPSLCSKWPLSRIF
jgi:hypothetical protein